MKICGALSIVATALVSSSLFTLALPPNPHWYCAYISLVPLLWSLSRCPSGPATRYPAFLFGVFVYEWNLCWFGEVFGLIGLILPLILSLILFVFAVHLAALRRVLGVGRALACTPVLWVAYILPRRGLASSIWLDHPWNNTGPEPRDPTECLLVRHLRPYLYCRRNECCVHLFDHSREVGVIPASTTSGGDRHSVSCI